MRSNDVDLLMQEITQDMVRIRRNLYITVTPKQFLECQKVYAQIQGLNHSGIEGLKKSRLRLLGEHNIGGIVACDENRKTFSKYGISYLNLDNSEPINVQAEKLSEFVEEMDTQNKSVLIQSVKLPNLSAIHAVAYLIMVGMSLQEAENVVREHTDFVIEPHLSDLEKLEDMQLLMRSTVRSQEFSFKDKVDAPFSNPCYRGSKISDCGESGLYGYVNSEILQFSQIDGYDCDTQSRHSNLLGSEVQCKSECGSALYCEDELNKINWENFRPPQPTQNGRVLDDTQIKGSQITNSMMFDSQISIQSERQTLQVNQERYTMKQVPVMQPRGGNKMDDGEKKQIRGPKAYNSVILPKQ